MTVDLRRLGTIFVIVAFLAVAVPVVVAAVPQLAGADHSYVVLSSSMEPSIQAGGLVLVSSVDPGTIGTGDVITFQPPDGTTQPTTHRVVDVVESGDGLAFRTKGDANAQADDEPVPADGVIGVVTADVPYVGRIVNFANSTAGVLVLVVLPALVLIAAEVRDVLAEFDGDETRTATGGESDD